MRSKLASWRGAPLSFRDRVWLMKWSKRVVRHGSAMTPESARELLERIRNPDAADRIDDVERAVRAALGSTPMWRAPYDPYVRHEQRGGTPKKSREETTYAEADDEWKFIPGASA